MKLVRCRTFYYLFTSISGQAKIHTTMTYVYGNDHLLTQPKLYLYTTHKSSIIKYIEGPVGKNTFIKAAQSVTISGGK